MTRPRLLATLGPLLLIAALAWTTSCSNKATNPTTNIPPKELDSGDIASGGGTFQHTFATAGTFNYHCTHHSMSGSVTVAAGQPASASVTIGDNFFNPASVMVAPGGTVHWTNGGGTAHTVTSS